MNKNVKIQDEQNSSIVLLFLHPHRVNDLKNWLKSIALAEELTILLVVSDRTVNKTEELINTKHIITVINLEDYEVQYGNFFSKSSLLMLWYELKHSYLKFKNRYKATLKLLSNYNESVLVTYDDCMPSLLPILKASNKLSIPVFLPAILTTQPDITATTSNTLKPKRKIEKYIVWFVQKIFPGHISSDGRLFYNAIDYLVLQWFRSVPLCPWVKGTLIFTTKLGVESRLAYEKLIAAGVDANKLELTGMPVYDLMDFSRKETNSNILLCALPQYGEHGAMDVNQALPLIEEILLAFKKFSGKVVISLHPRMDPKIYEPIVDKYGFKCVVGDIDQLLKKASLFFAASSSTTIYSALMMGVPTVALNHLRPKSSMFKDFSSIVYIEKNVESEIAVIIEQKYQSNWSDLLKHDQQLLSHDLVSDGKCGKRNLEIIEKLRNK